MMLPTMRPSTYLLAASVISFGLAVFPSVACPLFANLAALYGPIVSDDDEIFPSDSDATEEVMQQ